jgi:putative hydrolase of the HAD superfamily
MTMFDLIAFDADDTLWHNETLYRRARAKFEALMAPYCTPEDAAQWLDQMEMRNLEPFGYGIKPFILSMIETAVEISHGQIPAGEIQKIVDLAHEMVDADVELLDGVRETVSRLAGAYPLMLVTKGDPLDQERKLLKSGLGEYFRYVEIMWDKTKAKYAALFARYQVQPQHFLMVGNSLRSDILPVIELGGRAIYIPYRLTWGHENISIPDSHVYCEIDNMWQLEEAIARMGSEAKC